MDSISGWKYKELSSELPNNKGLMWVEEGNCFGKDTNQFIYPSNMPTRSQRHKLEKICEGCPVMLTCRYEAVRNQEEGWWGGMDAKQRKAWAIENLFKEKS